MIITDRHASAARHIIAAMSAWRQYTANTSLMTALCVDAIIMLLPRRLRADAESIIITAMTAARRHFARNFIGHFILTLMNDLNNLTNRHARY
jgi:hypothetical protein